MYAIKLAQVHCPKNNLILRMKTKPITAGVHATVYIIAYGRLLFTFLHICLHRNLT